MTVVLEIAAVGYRRQLNRFHFIRVTAEGQQRSSVARSAAGKRAFQCKGSRASDDESCDASEIEQIAFVARRAELGAAGSDGDELDGTESELQMNPEHRDEQDGCHWDSEEGNKPSGEYGEAAEDFDQDRDPGHPMRRRYGETLQGCCECFWPAIQFGITVLDEAESNDEAQRQKS